MHMSSGELREQEMDREAWRAVIHVVAKSQTRLSDWTELNWISDNSFSNCIIIFKTWLWSVLCVLVVGGIIVTKEEPHNTFPFILERLD